MDDMTAFERQVERRVHRYVGPARPVDDLAVYESVIAADRQKGWGSTMFSALKFLAAGVIVALFGGFLLAGVFTTQHEDGMTPAAVNEPTAQEDARTFAPPSEFSGTVGGCPETFDEGDQMNVVLGTLSEGNLVRREWRGHRFAGIVEGLSDPRLEGLITVMVNRDEYIYPGVDMDDPPALMSATMRIENEAGAWQGSYPEAHVPDSPLPYGELVPLAGEGAYEGLTAIWWTDLRTPDCACWDPENQCVIDVYGAVFHGEMPPTPAD